MAHVCAVCAVASVSLSLEPFGLELFGRLPAVALLLNSDVDVPLVEISTTAMDIPDRAGLSALLVVRMLDVCTPAGAAMSVFATDLTLGTRRETELMDTYDRMNTGTIRVSASVSGE